MKHSKQFILSPRSYGSFLKDVYNAGEPISPRGIPTWEVIGADFTIKNPRDRIVTAMSRRNNVAFGIAEWFSFMLGIDDLKYFQSFITAYDKYSSDGEVVDGCYGTRVNEPRQLERFVLNQVYEVIDHLRVKPESRQAVISIYNKADLFGAGGKNTPCTLSLQFLVRDGSLHMITYMRSSDAYKGVTGDILVFTLVQEYVARALGLPLGQYLHRAGSLHVYNTDVDKIQEILKDYRWPLLMMEMPVLEHGDMERARIYIGLMMETPENIANIHYTMREGWSSNEARVYLTSLLNVMASFTTRLFDDKTISAYAFDNVKDRTLRYVLRPWLTRAGVLPELKNNIGRGVENGR